ncbi:MAG: type 1 glutamine amidotransferase domain-containing protein [bacterium]
MSLKRKKVAILVEQDYQDQEVWYPYFRLTEEGAQISLVAPKANQVYPSKHGYPITSTLSSSAALKRRFDAVVIPGGWAPDFLRRDPNMAKLVRKVHDSGGIIAAICHGGWMLVSADILKGRTATSFFAIKDDMLAAGAKWVDRETVKDGNLITARKPDDLPLFVRTLIDALS